MTAIRALCSGGKPKGAARPAARAPLPTSIPVFVVVRRTARVVSLCSRSPFLLVRNCRCSETAVRTRRIPKTSRRRSTKIRLPASLLPATIDTAAAFLDVKATSPTAIATFRDPTATPRDPTASFQDKIGVRALRALIRPSMPCFRATKEGLPAPDRAGICDGFGS